MTSSFIKHSLGAVVLLLASWSANAADVGFSVSVGDPNFYGRIDVGQYRPEVIYTRPVIIHQAPYGYPPIYLRVPPGHAKHWHKHCGYYGACARPVYFVHDRWYRDTYRTRYYGRADSGYVGERHHGHGHHHGERRRHGDRD
ncbi:hypothetical protein [Chitinibacter sp. S2-10]|uniref:hypothetical protein n=1 Tax=Chitinibacter sp. S2-10 TaxID=3373597 RepID=UPI0039777661